MLPAPTQGLGALRDSGPSGCEEDYSKSERHASLCTSSCNEDNLIQDNSIYRGVRFSGVLLLRVKGNRFGIKKGPNLERQTNKRKRSFFRHTK